MFAPCAGEAVAVADLLPYMRTPEVDRVDLTCNHVTLCRDSIDVALARFRANSVKAARGARVRVGDLSVR